jgi:hypothetical protein
MISPQATQNLPSFVSDDSGYLSPGIEADKSFDATRDLDGFITTFLVTHPQPIILPPCPIYLS